MLAALLAVAVRPPAAYIDAGKTRVPLTISSWCWAARCAAPIARSRHIAVTQRGAVVRIELAFAPTEVRLVIGGTPVKVNVQKGMLSWRATRGGGISLTATGVHGFVTYVGRLGLR